MAKTSQQSASVADEEPSFPRGGASSITPLKRRQIRAEAQADAEKDFLAGTGEPDSNKRRKKSGRSAPAQVMCCTFELSLNQRHYISPARPCSILPDSLT